MRKIITTTFVTLDGIMQAPGGPEEDTTGGFAYGGWQIAHPTDEVLSEALNEIMTTPFELLLGKKTYDIFASFWPTATTDMEVANPFNTTKKHVVSHESFDAKWNNSHVITGDVVAQIQKLKEEDGPDLWIWGSGNLIQTLLEHHLIDRMQVWTYPITLGTGKRLFAEGTPPQRFTLVDTTVSSVGVILATYEPTGDFKSS